MEIFNKIIGITLSVLLISSAAFAQECDIPSALTTKWSSTLDSISGKCQIKCQLTKIGFNGSSMVLLQCIDSKGKVVFQPKPTNGCPNRAWWDNQISTIDQAATSGQCFKGGI